MLHQRAISLVEVLAIVCIALLLLAIPVVIFSGNHESGQQAQCLSQLQQMLATTTAFASDDRIGRVIPAWSDEEGVGVQHALSIAAEELPADERPLGIGQFEAYGYSVEHFTDPGRDFTPSESGDQFVHAYQYFGGIDTWHNLPGTTEPVEGMGMTTLDDMTHEKTLIADHVMCQGDLPWGEATDATLAGSPAHGLDGDEPRGGNHVFGDGSGQWVTFDQMHRLHSWDDEVGAFYYQDDLGEYDPPQ